MERNELVWFCFSFYIFCVEFNFFPPNVYTNCNYDLPYLFRELHFDDVSLCASVRFCVCEVGCLIKRQLPEFVSQNLVRFVCVYVCTHMCV